MATRKISEVPITKYLQNGDVLLFEQDNFVSADDQAIKEKLHQIPVFCENPQIYSVTNKGGTLTSRSEVYLTVKNILLSCYSIYKNVTIYLGLFNSTTKFVNYGTAEISTISGIDTLEFIYDDLSSDRFIENDSTSFTGILISPYGNIPGTENWLQI